MDMDMATTTTTTTEMDNILPPSVSGGISTTELNENVLSMPQTAFSLLTIEGIVVSILLGILILITALGNIFVIAAILLERNLKTVANYLVLSLAVADLMVACLVMPLGAVNEVTGQWNLGTLLCELWTSCDVMCCTASILHLLAIALDRYWAVTSVDYACQRSARRIWTMIVVVWAVSIAVSVAPVFGWKDSGFEDRIEIEKRCMVSQNVAYQVFATCSSFYLPLVLILLLYWKIYQAARKRIRHKPGKSAVLMQLPEKKKKTRRSLNFQIGKSRKSKSEKRKETSSSAVEFENTSNADHEESVSERPTSTTVEEDNSGGTQSCESALESTVEKLKNNNQSVLEDGDAEEGLEGEEREGEVRGEEIQMNCDNGAETRAAIQSGMGRLMVLAKREKKQTKESLESKRERKAAKTLAIITGVFVFCWLPFFVTALVIATCTSCEPDPVLFSILLWLGYLNSLLNPVIYTVFSPDFRNAFRRILCNPSRSSQSLRPYR